MKLPLIFSLLISGAVGSKVINNNIVNNINQEAIVENSEKNSDILTAYIDGENKVYLNDINDSELVEDNWSPLESKLVSITIDASKLDKYSRYIELEIPLGFELNTTPELLLDNNLIEVDKTSFRSNTFLLGNGGNYTSNSGVLKYKISPDATSVSFNFLISIDNTFIIRNESLDKKDLKPLIISVGDDNFKISKKIDKIKTTVKDAISPWVWGASHNSTSNLGEKSYFEGDLQLYSNRKLFKNLTVYMEKPYVEKTKDGVVEKVYLDVVNPRFDNINGSVTETDTQIIFSLDNYYEKVADALSFSINIDPNIFNHLDVVKWSFTEYSYTEMITNETIVVPLTSRNSFQTKIIDTNQEYIAFDMTTFNVYKNEKNLEPLVHLGCVSIQNHGGVSSSKTLDIEFPMSGFGVRSFRIPHSSLKNSYILNFELWNAETNEIVSGSATINRASSSNESGTLVNVDTIVSKSGLSLNASEFFIKKISYEIGSLPNKYSSGGKYYSSYGGNFYGRVLSNSNINSRYKVKASLSNTEDGTFLFNKESDVTLSSKGIVELRYSNLEIRDNQNKLITEIEAGNSFTFKGKMYVPNYRYTNYNSLLDVSIYMKVPRGLEIDDEKSYLSHTVQGDVNFKSVKVKSVGDFDVYKIDVPSVIIGGYQENLASYGELSFGFYFNISKSIKSLSLNFKNSMFIYDKFIDFYGGVRDVDDFDNDGDLSKSLGVLDDELKISIISNSNWLSVDSSIGISGVSQAGTNITIEDPSNIVEYSININNNNEGYVRPGNFEYYIPIPKKDLEYNSNIKDKDEVFNFNMVLNEKMSDISGFEITYSYDNVNFEQYNIGLDLSRVSMIKIVNIKDINLNEKLQLSINMSYEEGSWDGSSGNDVIWSAYGNQVYEKNGGESGYLHVMDRIKLEIVKAPVIKDNLESIVANINDTITLSADIDLGIPLANIKWQYRESSESNWIDLSEISSTLVLDNINYLMNGYQYRYEVSNKGGSITSNIATLNVADNSAPTIELTEFKDDDGYKIRVDVTDEDSGVSHIILPDGSRIDSDTFIFDAVPDIEYIFKAYDLAGNESIAKITVIGGLVPKTVTGNLDVYIKSINTLSLSLSSNSISFEDFNGTENLEQQGALELTVNSSLPYEINAYLEGEIQNSDKTEVMDKRILNLKESNDADYKEFTDIKTKLTLVPHSDAGNDKVHSFDFKLNGGIAHKKDVYKASIKLEVNQK